MVLDFIFYQLRYLPFQSPGSFDQEQGPYYFERLRSSPYASWGLSPMANQGSTACRLASDLSILKRAFGAKKGSAAKGESDV